MLIYETTPTQREDSLFMNKPEFIAAVSDKAGLSRKDTERVINAALDTITVALT